VKINYNKGVAVTLVFSITEAKVALAVLKDLHKSTQQDFIQEAITDIEGDMQPKKLPMKNYFHWCKDCGRDLDERSDNAISITKDGDTYWKHKVCVPLKPDSQRER